MGEKERVKLKRYMYRQKQDFYIDGGHKAKKSFCSWRRNVTLKTICFSLNLSLQHNLVLY